MKDIRIAASADWHLGNSNLIGEYPNEQDIRASLQNALDSRVDAYVFAGDIVDKGSVLYAKYAASIIRPYVKAGLPVIAIDGNHDYTRDEGKDPIMGELAKAGVIVLNNSSYTITSKNSGRNLTVIGVSGETGTEYGQWKSDPDGEEAGWEKAYNAGKANRQALQRELEKSGENVLILTHRGIIADTVGTAAREGAAFSPQTFGFTQIIDSYAFKGIAVFHGHNHGPKPWEGFLFGRTPGGVEVDNVAAPVRRRYRYRMPLALYKNF